MGKYFEKTALNALKARELAKSVGLIPEAQWKWGLRKLRAPRSKDAPLMLEGKALRKAKEDRIGLLSNNEIQKIRGLQRKQNLGVEVGLDGEGVFEGIKGNLIPRIYGKDPKTYNLKAHTHPGFNRIKNLGSKDTELKRTLNNTLAASPSGQNPSVTQEVVQKIKKNPNLKENYDTYRAFLRGDLKAAQKNKHNILSPKTIGVHRYREYKLPRETRSVYFKGGLDG